MKDRTLDIRYIIFVISITIIGLLLVFEISAKANADTDNKYSVTSTGHCDSLNRDITTTLDMSKYKSYIEENGLRYFTYIFYSPNNIYSKYNGYAIQGICFYSTSNFIIAGGATNTVTSTDGTTIYYDPCSYYYGSMLCNMSDCEKIISTDAQYYFTSSIPTSVEEMKDKINEYLEKYFRNNCSFSGMDVVDMKGYQFDTNGNLVKKESKYDLELPLNVKIKTKDWSGSNPKHVSITWEQSNDVDVTGWQTEIYVKQTGKTGKYIWSLVNKKSFESPWFKDGYVPNFEQQYLCNILNYEKTNQYITNLRGYEPQLVQIDSTDFMLRNYYIDSDDVEHFSNFCYLKQDSSGDYHAFEVDSKTFNEEHGMEDGYVTDLSDEDLANLVNTNSENYMNEDVDNNTKYGLGNINSISDLFSSLTKVFKNAGSFVGDFPGLLSDVFSFMPGSFVTFIVLGVGVVIVLRVLGR